MDTELDHHREQAEQIRTKLAEELHALKFLEYELRQRFDQDADERTRARAAASALDHLQEALEAIDGRIEGR